MSNYPSTTYLTFNCIRLHVLINTHYKVLVTDQYLLIQKKSKYPKYHYELSLDNILYWYVSQEQLQAFGIKYQNKVKFFQADFKELNKLREHTRNKIVFENIVALYSIRKLIAEGADSTVYKVEDNLSHQMSALKCQQNKDDFIQEMQSVRILTHQNIIQIKECFRGEQYHYIIMELMNGGSLREFLVEKPTHIECKTIMKQLLNATAYMHSKGLIHRDIKPENIMFQIKSRVDSLKLVDFGFAVFDSIAEFPHPKCGSPGYVAPEILNLRNQVKYSNKCDIFSLGAIMYRLYAGKELFNQNQTIEDIISVNAQCRWDMNPLLHSRTPIFAQELIKRMLVKDPMDRISAEDALNHKYFQCDQLSSAEKKMRFQKRFNDSENVLVGPTQVELDESIPEQTPRSASLPKLVVKIHRQQAC